ncbi:sigma-70 family RNA polymerase sigma factor [Sorangium sp. So ce118]
MSETKSDVIEEERRLIRRVKAGDQRAARDLIEMHSGFLATIARHYSRVPGYDFDDAMQQARIGCIDAAERFDFAREVRFTTYAGWRIRHHVERELQNTVGDIRVPVYQQTRCGAKPVRALRLDSPLRNMDGHESGRSLRDILVADGVPQDEQIDAGRVAVGAKSIVPRLIRGLNDRELLIVREHLCRDEADKVPLAHLGKRIGVSRERMRQVRDELVVKLRRKASRLGARQLLAA